MNFWKTYYFLSITHTSRFLGSGPDRGRSPVEWGEIPYVRPSVRPSVRPYVPPLAGPQTLLAGPQTPPAGPQTLLAGPQTPPASPQTPPAGPQTPPAGPQTPPAGPQTPQPGPQGLRASQQGLRASWRGLGASQQGLRASQRGDVRTDRRTDGRTEFLPILQDFVPCRGRCPKSSLSSPISLVLCRDQISFRPSLHSTFDNMLHGKTQQNERVCIEPGFRFWMRYTLFFL